MSDLPHGWIEPAISEVAEVNPRKDVDLSASDLVSFVPMAAVDEITGTITSSADRSYGEVSKGFTHFRDGDVIFAKITPSMENGKSAVARGLTNGTGMGSTEFHVFRSNGAIEPEYLWRFVRQKSFRENAQAVMSGAVGQQRVPADYLKDHPIPLAPLPEQQRIVAKMDGLTARTASARKELDRVPTLIARYKQRLLALAFSEFGSKAEVEHLPFSDVVSSAQNGISKRRGDTGRMINVLRLADLTDGHFVGHDPREIMLTVAEEEKYGLETDDLICIRVNGSEKLVGRMLVWEGQLDWAFCDHFIRFKTNSMVCLSKYVSYFFASDKVRAQIESSFVSSAGQKTVSQGTLGRILVPVPPREEQAKIVRRIESAFGWLDRMAADHAAAARLLPKLDAAILAKAFQGKLVPQDPDDEPAAKLLERIKAEREATPKVKRGRKANLPPITGTLEITLGPVTVSATGTVGNAPTGARKVSMTKSRQDDDVKGKPYLAGLLKSGRYSDAQSLFRGAELPVADFYKQLAWEIDKGHILDSADELKAA